MKNILKQIMIGVMTIGVCGLCALVGFILFTSFDSSKDEYRAMTGYDLASGTTFTSAYDYINGALNGVVTADVNHQFVCERPFVPDDRNTIIAVYNQIKYHTDLQNQAATYSVINAYNQLYCSGK